MWEKLTIQQREENCGVLAVFLQLKENMIFCASGGPSPSQKHGTLHPWSWEGRRKIRAQEQVSGGSVRSVFSCDFALFSGMYDSESEVREEALELEGRSERRYRRERTRAQSWEMKSNCQTVSGCT